jgi:hypothetical protein
LFRRERGKIYERATGIFIESIHDHRPAMLIDGVSCCFSDRHLKYPERIKDRSLVMASVEDIDARSSNAIMQKEIRQYAFEPQSLDLIPRKKPTSARQHQCV